MTREPPWLRDLFGTLNRIYTEEKKRQAGLGIRDKRLAPVHLHFGTKAIWRGSGEEEEAARANTQEPCGSRVWSPQGLFIALCHR
jgi:hypothetical protein